MSLPKPVAPDPDKPIPFQLTKKALAELSRACSACNGRGPCKACGGS